MEFDVDEWDRRARELLDPIVAIFVMSWIVTGRYTDRAPRARRSEPLSAAAEVQWDLLPPLACSTDDVALSGILEPADLCPSLRATARASFQASRRS